MSSGATLVLAGLLSGLGPAADAGRFTANTLSGMSTAELASQLLPAEAAGKVTDHEVIEPRGLALTPAILLFARAEKVADEICRRDVYHLSFSSAHRAPDPAQKDAPLKAGTVTPGAQIALAARCAGLPRDRFAFVQPAAEAAGAVAALRWLASARRAAAAGRTLPMALTCSTKIGPDRCRGGAQAVLATLPLEQTFIIAPVPSEQQTLWQFSVMPTGPGQLFWQVTIDTAPATPQIDMTWTASAPS